MDEIKKVVKKRKPRVLTPESKEEVLKPIQLKKAVEDAMSNMSTEELAAKLGIELK